jgi:leader peptidase (prepilin peptidase) / N-methyltransferase
MAQFLFPYFCAALFGLIFGSFLNVCISRLPQHESIVTPRSHCPRCNKPIQWYDNIPAISYLFLRGRCRHCHEKISIIYPLVEVLTSALWVVTLAEYELSPEFIKYVLLGMLLLILIFTDLRERIIPHSVTLFGIGAGLLLSFMIPVDNRPLDWALGLLGFFPNGAFDSFLGAVAGAVAGGGLFYAVGEGFYYASGRTKEYLGFGDVMLMFMAGTFLGAPLTLLTILLGSLGGSLLAGPATLLSPRLREYEWPYGTFLGIAAIFSFLGGPALLEWYLHWSGIA